MKKIDQFLFKSFIGPFVITFFIALFILVMQFLWKYVDELVGKGLEIHVLVKLLFYHSMRLVPLALPLAVLLASIMTFGNLGEYYELTAMKSAGISLFRIMRGLIITAVVLSIFAFVFSNEVLPWANLKSGSLLYDIKHQKPTFSLREGIFNNSFDGFSIRAEEKDEDGQTLKDIMIYDHSSRKGNDLVITAKSGYMYQTSDRSAIIFKLFDGHQYREIPPKTLKDNSFEHYRTRFESWEKVFDLSEFEFSRVDEKFFKDLHQMLDIVELTKAIDTISIERSRIAVKLDKNTESVILAERYKLAVDTIINKVGSNDVVSLLRTVDPKKRKSIFEKANFKAKNMKSFAGMAGRQLERKNRDLVVHWIEWHRKFTLSIACLVLFFIGAPLGSIIRKGGLGWPFFWSIIFFIIFHVTSISGEKMAEEMTVSPFFGMWMSTFILFPVGAFLTYKAANDSNLFEARAYRTMFTFVNRVFGKLSKRIETTN
ncbi:MAG: YjgP/YjgQ family permease [Chitinophagales bacterium]|nr:YjgP/YjgQ family permease [Chitinophagales bacterium]